MKLVTLELKHDEDIELLVAFTKRIDGEILNIKEASAESSQGPVYWLDELARRGGINTINDPSEWQRDQRSDKMLVNR
jgi:hypothetical protein